MWQDGVTLIHTAPRVSCARETHWQQPISSPRFWGLLLTRSLRKQAINANAVAHERWGSGPLNPYWPAHFPRKRVCVPWWCWRQAALWACFLWATCAVWCRAAAERSSNEKSRCRSDPQGGSPCLRMFNLTPPPFFRLPDPRVDVVLLRPKWVKLCLILFILNIIYRLKTVTGIMVTNLNDVTFSFIHSENYDINADVSTALSSFKRLHNVGWRNE